MKDGIIGRQRKPMHVPIFLAMYNKIRWSKLIVVSFDLLWIASQTKLPQEYECTVYVTTQKNPFLFVAHQDAHINLRTAKASSAIFNFFYPCSYCSVIEILTDEIFYKKFFKK